MRSWRQSERVILVWSQTETGYAHPLTRLVLESRRSLEFNECNICKKTLFSSFNWVQGKHQSSFTVACKMALDLFSFNIDRIVSGIIPQQLNIRRTNFRQQRNNQSWRKILGKKTVWSVTLYRNGIYQWERKQHKRLAWCQVIGPDNGNLHSLPA